MSKLSARPLRPSFARIATPLVVSLGFVTTGFAQTVPTPAVAPVGGLSEASLAKLTADLDAARVKAGIVGMSLVVVQDDKVVLLKGFGQRDAAKKLPVTSNTLFQIGSSTKAFTALSVLMAVDDGKLQLSDSPKKYLPYFRINDPATDKAITIRDLMCHRSGLTRTDLAMMTGGLNREELIRVAGIAKPTAKLGEKFQYQNIMFTAAGEAAAQAEKTPYESLVEKRILAPLGMSHTIFSVSAMQHSSDFSRGYRVSTETKAATMLPERNIEATAPAGAIESNAQDMALWLRFMLNGDGTFGGKRLVSAANFAELTKPQMSLGGTQSYGLGWFLEDWKGHKVVEHGGNIDGFSTAVAFMPDRRLGFALLINDNDAALGPQSLGMVWNDLVSDGSPQTASATGAAATAAANAAATTPSPAVPPLAPETLPGTYSSTTPAISMTVAKGAEGKLTLTVIGQPPYPLEVVIGNRYKLGAPAPDGFFATFRPVAAGTELFLEQPQGNFTLTREAALSTAELSPALQAIAGDYDKDGRTVSLTGQNGTLSAIIPGQPAYPLVASADAKPDTFTSPALPSGFVFEIQRDAATGKPVALMVHQPNGDFRFTRVAAGATADLPTVDDLLAKMIAAAGGEAALRRHKTSVTTATVDFENQGVTAEETEWARAPDALATHLNLIALGKKIATVDEFCDGPANAGAQWSSFSPVAPFEGKTLVAEKREADFYSNLLDAHTVFATIEIRRHARVGSEDAFVVVETPKGGGIPATIFVSAKTYLVLRRDTTDPDSGLPLSSTLGDYRPVDGVQTPFLSIEQDAAQGTVVTRVQTVKFDVPVPDRVFHAPTGK